MGLLGDDTSELWHPLSRYLGSALRDLKLDLGQQPSSLLSEAVLCFDTDIVAACLSFVPHERPSFDQVVSAVNSLSHSAVVEVEETLRIFFGQS